MLSSEFLHELRRLWLPHVTDAGLARLIELLEQDSPLLIHRSFSRIVPQGCLATHIGWHHPSTANLTLEAGVRWLNRVARVNPATSHVLRDWDAATPGDVTLRRELCAELKEHLRARREASAGANRIRHLVDA